MGRMWRAADAWKAVLHILPIRRGADAWKETHGKLDGEKREMHKGIKIERMGGREEVLKGGRAT